ncbi:GNAT family N-acetyltransferase [uncultured Rummeliibacillus sp.]|uniref:GNAT family N-acetyltransferase n=1 Tax=uncultured Rummeliibacillus sp. TaxID=762292 RepID=UPI0026150893|nr:GNAT family N-acetyltransferase [uncultured Rummeliibacillus sp.]
MQINQKELNLIDRIQNVTNSKQIIDVIHAAFKRYETDPMPSSALSETSMTVEENLKDGIRIFGAYVKEQLVGVVKVMNQKDSLYFSRLSVLPTYQGKGIASALVTYIEKVAYEENINHVKCKVRKSEKDNIRLYSKLGYHITKEELTTSPTGFKMATVTMQKGK